LITNVLESVLNSVFTKGPAGLLFYGSLAGKVRDFTTGIMSFGKVNGLSGDSLRGAEMFLQEHAVNIQPHTIRPVNDNLIYYVLFGLLTLFAFIRFFYPAATRTVLSWFSGTGLRRSEDNFGKPGLLVPLFLMFNFFVSVAIMAFVVLVKMGTLSADIYFSSQFWVAAVGMVVAFYLFNQLSTFLIGFAFDTGDRASMQMKNNAVWAYVNGLFLTPLLLVYFYTKNDFLFGIMIAGLIILLLLKWVQTVKIGLATQNFNMLHLFLYLCAVEIIPLFLLVKVCAI